MKKDNIPVIPVISQKSKNDKSKHKNKTSFAKGRSGNPKGRPKTKFTPIEVYQAFLESDYKGTTRLHQLATELLDIATRKRKDIKPIDQIRAIEALLNRAYGKPRESVEIDNGNIDDDAFNVNIVVEGVSSKTLQDRA